MLLPGKGIFSMWMLYLAGIMEKCNCIAVRMFKTILGHSNLITCLTSFFWKKNPVRLQKKKEKKKSPWVSYGRKWF